MIDKILAHLRAHPKSLAVLFALVFLLIYGFKAFCFAAVAGLFLFFYVLIITSGNDHDDFFDNFNPWKFA